MKKIFELDYPDELVISAHALQTTLCKRWGFPIHVQEVLAKEGEHSHAHKHECVDGTSFHFHEFPAPGVMDKAKKADEIDGAGLDILAGLVAPGEHLFCIGDDHRLTWGADKALSAYSRSDMAFLLNHGFVILSSTWPPAVPDCRYKFTITSAGRRALTEVNDREPTPSKRVLDMLRRLGEGRHIFEGHPLFGELLGRGWLRNMNKDYYAISDQGCRVLAEKADKCRGGDRGC